MSETITPSQGPSPQKDAAWGAVGAVPPPVNMVTTDTNQVITGDKTFTGMEGHTGAEAHSGPESHGGAVIFDNTTEFNDTANFDALADFDGAEDHSGIETHSGVCSYTSRVEIASLAMNGSTPPGAATTLNETSVPFVLVSTAAGAYTVNLPAAPSEQMVYYIKDYTGNAGANNITVNGNGNNIDGVASMTINTNFGVLRVMWGGARWATF